MKDPFVTAVVETLQTHLNSLGLDFPMEIAPAMVERPPNPEMGDYALPCFGLAKSLKKAPHLIAETLALSLAPVVEKENLKSHPPENQPLIAAVEAAGPYLNFRVNTARMAMRTLSAVLDGSYFTWPLVADPGEGQGKKVMVEYSQPNTHKAFHVGHMRNVALGDGLARILAYTGRSVTAVNYIGDVGTHIAKCLWFYLNHRSSLPPEKQNPPDPADPHALDRGEWLGELYTAATRLLESARGETKTGYEQEISRVLQQLEAAPHNSSAVQPSSADSSAQEPSTDEVCRLWQSTRQWSLDSFQEVYGWLGAHFDHDFYESDMEASRRIVEEGLQKGVFIRSQGAVGADLEPYGLGFFLVLKGDGTTLYSTKDLALAEMKYDRFAVQESIYVVGAEQTLHFKQVFKTLELLGYPQAKTSSHLAYGLVMLPEGKMSSRGGNVILFSSLRSRMNRFILTHYLEAHRGDWPDEEITETCRRIAVAAIRYGMVKQDPTKTIIFNLEDWLVAEGDTGVYLCYAYTRIQSVLRMMGLTPGQPLNLDADYTLLTHPAERVLLRELYDFNRVAAQAARLLRPNLVAGALFQLAKEFSRTYAACSVKNAETPQQGQARLALFAATGKVLHTGLGLLGITPPDRM